MTRPPNDQLTTKLHDERWGRFRGFLLVIGHWSCVNHWELAIEAPSALSVWCYRYDPEPVSARVDATPIAAAAESAEAPIPARSYGPRAVQKVPDLSQALARLSEWLMLGGVQRHEEFLVRSATSRSTSGAAIRWV